MTEHYRDNAQSIVDAFKSVLEDDQISAIGEENFDQLRVLVESGIATVLLQNMEAVADRIDALGHEVRNQAEHFEDN
jgi:hypothetical protein